MATRGPNLHGTWLIFTMRPDGTAIRQLTHAPGSTDNAMFPTRSPSGGRLAFSSHAAGSSDIYVVNRDGTGMHRITSGQTDELTPAWSPDGRRIAFARFDPGDFDRGALWSMAPDGSDQRRLTANSFNSDILPVYTPDGRHIVFTSSKGGLVAAVWVMNADGSGQHRLTPAAQEGTAWDISPDGRHILFGDHQNTSLATSLLVMDLDGAGVRRLTTAGCCFHDASARYSPDGTKIAFTTDRTFAGRGIHEAEIWEMDADGTHLHPKTSSLTLGCVGPLDWGHR